VARPAADSANTNNTCFFIPSSSKTAILYSKTLG
jgi:hypothetical protein